jgi:hypothetical protein
VGLVKDEVTVANPHTYFWFPMSVLWHQWSTPVFILIFSNYYLPTKLWSVWCLRFPQSRCRRFASSRLWMLRRWASGSRRFEGSKCLDLQVQALFSDFALQVRSQPAHGSWQHSLPVLIKMHLFAPAVTLSSPCSSQHNATTATSLRIPYVFEHVRSKRTALDCRTSV